MTTLLDDLRTAAAGSPELSARVWQALTGERYICDGIGNIGRLAPNGTWYEIVPCITTDLSAACEEAERRGYFVSMSGPHNAFERPYRAQVDLSDRDMLICDAHTMPLALCAALVAAGTKE